MNLRKTIHKTHLILGLTSGLVVFVVSITGCLLAFEKEIKGLNQSWKKTEIQEGAFLPPSKLKPLGDALYPGRTIHGIAYGKKNETAEIVFFEREPLFYRTLYVNPYNGELVKDKNQAKDFFRVILMGHYQLWLPEKIGQPIVAWSALIFVVMLISGIKLWWPRGKRPVAESFKIKWAAKLRRKFFDMHSVLGFYASAIILLLALTGMVWGFQWFSKTAYKAMGGKKELAYTHPLSDSTRADHTFDADQAADWLFYKVIEAYPEGSHVEIHFPEENNHEALFAHVNPSHYTWWQTDYIYYDRYTLAEMESNNIWGKLKDANTADKIRRMNYDIHIGAIAGLPGKIIVFLASLIAASLPVTGFVFWRIKTREKKKFLKEMNI
jgi:uncharacterized iron-regulated membrane protein